MFSAFEQPSSASTPQSAFANNGNGFGMFATSTTQMPTTSFFTSPAAEPAATATPSAFLSATPSAFPTPSPSPPLAVSSAFPSTSAFAAVPSSASPAPLTSAFAFSGPRVPSHLIAPKPPSSASPQPLSKLSASASPFQPAVGSGTGTLSAINEADEWQEGAGDEQGMYGGEDEEAEGEVAEEEAEIHRLEEARVKRKERFNHSGTPATAQFAAAPTSSSARSGTSAAKLAVARAAGMAISEYDEAQADDGDELIVATAETRIKGQCTSMCTRKEVLDRLESHTISVLEMEQGQSPAALSPTDAVPLAVKKYRRAAAAQQLDPRDVRTPTTLLATCQHLIDRVVDRSDVAWHEVHRFVTDRFRAVRSDFVCQGVVSADTVQCLEWMARFHTTAMDVLRTEPTETFDPIQNMEKLTQTLTSLRLLYRDNSASAQPFPVPSEAEMQGCLLFTTFNRNFFSTYTSLSPALQASAPVQFALSCYNAMRENNYALFFSLLRRASYLQLCLCLPFVGRVRERALHTICRAYQRFSVAAITKLLAMDDESQTVAMLAWYGVAVEAGADEIVLVSGGKNGRRQQFVANANGVFAEDSAERLVSSKRPATKRLAIRTTLEDALSTPAAASTNSALEIVKRTVTKQNVARQATAPSAPSRPPTASSAFALSASLQTPPSLPPAAFVPTPASGNNTTPVRARRDTPAPPPSFNSFPQQFTAPPPAAFSALTLPPPPRTSPRQPPSAVLSSIPPTFSTASPAPSFTSQQPFVSSQPTFRPAVSSASALPAPSVSAFNPHRITPVVVSPKVASIPPVSPSRAAASLASPKSTSALPLMRSLSSQQRDERLRREVEQSMLRQQQQLEREHTAAQLQLAAQQHVASLLRRWQRAAQERRAERANRERQLIAADGWYRQGLVLVALLHWHGQWREREERRESDETMRRAMSEGQHGLSAVHAGLMTMEEKLRQLYGEQAASALRLVSADASEMDEALPMYEDEDVTEPNGANLSSSYNVGLDLARLVADEMAARNPTQHQLYFHVLVSVGDDETPYSQLLLNKLSRHTSAATAYHSTPGRKEQLLLLPSDESAMVDPPLSSYTAKVSTSTSARQLSVRVQCEGGSTAASACHIGYQGAVFLLSSALGLEDVPSVVSHPDPSSPDSSTASAFVVPPASRFEHDQQRLSAFIATLHRHSALPLVILYPLAPSALSYMQLYGSASSVYFQQHAALMLMHCLRLTNVDARVVSDISISPLSLPSSLFSASFTASSDAPLLGYNDDCLRAAVTHLAASSPPHPVLHRIDVPDALEQRLQLCTGWLDDCVVHWADVLTASPSSLRPAADDLSVLLSTFLPQLYVDHFNACVHSFKRRLFGAGVKEMSWPPEGSGLPFSASPSSGAARNVKQLLSLLPLPDFLLSTSSSSVLDWSWLDCHSAATAYLHSYATLLELTQRTSGDEAGQQSAIDSDLYTLHRHAYDAFATAAPVHAASDGTEQRSVQEVTAYDRLDKMNAWHGWLLALLEHRLVSELSLHPLMLDAQPLYSLVPADALTEQHDTDKHSHTLPSAPSTRGVEINGAVGEVEASSKRAGGQAAKQPALVKRRKLDAHTNGTAHKRGAESRDGDRSHDTALALVPAASAKVGSAARKDKLWLALEDEKRRQSRLNAMLDEIEASMQQ